MDQDRSDKAQETSELGMTEAITPKATSRTKCPSCGRDVEVGFRFCDYCGTKLEAGPMTAPPVAPPRPEQPKAPLFERLRDRWKAREEASSNDEPRAKDEPAKEQPAKAEPAKDGPATTVAATPAVQEPPRLPDPLVSRQSEDLAKLRAEDRKPPLLERLRSRRKEKEEEAATRPPVAEKPVAEKLAAPPEPSVTKPAVTPPTRPRSHVTRAGDLHAASAQGRAVISGRLRWQEEESPPAPGAAGVVAPTWRPAPSAFPESSTAAMMAMFVVHLVLSFLVGAVLLGVAAVVASLTSDGRVALLEIRGLPIFIAGATAIIVFALLRTGPRRRGSNRWVAASVFVGFVVLVVAVALAYQPSVMADAQSRLDRSLGVFGAEVVDGVQRYEGDLDQWNAEVARYRDEHLTNVVKSRRTETDAKKFAKAEQTFRTEAAASEVALEGLVKRMRSHGDAIPHAPLRDALNDLTAIFADELSGIRSITRGLTNNDSTLVEAGDGRFKDATQRAVDFFEERVRPILERGDLDADSFGASVEMLLRG